MNSEKVETWPGIIISPTWHVQKSREGYRKNWMHFMNKLNNLFRSIRVLDEKTHLLQRHFIFLKFITTPNIFCIQYARFKATSSTFNPFWHHLLFLIHLLICFQRQMTVKLKSSTKRTVKRLKLGMVSSFHTHSMCKKVERVTAKTGCTSCTIWTISFEVSGFRMKKFICYTCTSFFKTYYNSVIFCIQYAPFKATSSTFNPFWHHLLIFIHLPICFES